MTPRRDPDQRIHAFLQEGQERLDDRIYDAVRAEIDHTRQRAVVGPWRVPDLMNRFSVLAGSAIALVLIVIVGSQLLARGGTSGPGAGPSASPTSIGGTVSFFLDDSPATTEVDAVATGGTVSGTAVTTFGGGTHTVRLECAARDGDFWAVAGTVERTTVSDEAAGDWSAVVVKEGSPQQVGIWISDPKVAGTDCAAWLAQIDMPTIDAGNFHLVNSGTLVPPPDAGS